jgi:hypothetical protein
MRIQRVRTAAAVLCVAVLTAACASTPEPVFMTPISGTRVSIVLPDSYWLAEGFQGVVGEPAGTTILVTEMSESEAALASQMSREELAARGMELLESEAIDVDGAERVIVHVRQTGENGVLLRRWILVLGDTANSTVLVATTPVDHEEEVGSLIVGALRSAERDPNRAIEPFAGLGFEVDETEALEIAGRDANIVAFRERGSADAEPVPGAPRVIVGRAWASEPLDVEQFSEFRLAQTPHLTDIAVTSRQALEIDGMPAFELVADAVDDSNDEALTLVQTLLLDSGRYYLVQGRVGRTDADRFIPEFRAVAAGFRRSP